MKLSDWARKNQLSYKTAYRLYKSGNLPCRCEQLATGTILVYEDEAKPFKVTIYARVSSHDQKCDLDRQIERLRDFCSARGWTISKEVREIGSGLNGHRKKLLKILSDSAITDIVVEHRDRLSRFGVEMIESALNASGRRLVVVNQSEFKDDLVQDFVDVVTSMCARIYGRRSSRARAKRALEAVSN